MAGPERDGMDPGRWKRLRELFDAALDLPEGERDVFVARSCAGDPELRAHLDSLLRHARETGSDFDRAVAGLVDVEDAIPTRLEVVGRTLGRYRVAEKIGQGGMGEVYRAVDTQLGRQVAIKILPERFTADPERLARFEREARLLASLSHPNIATIHGLEQVDGLRYLVLELIEGDTLRDAFDKGPLPIRRVVRLAAQIADGLAKAHEAGVVHRDLKPENLKLTGDGLVKILDFGLAKSAAPTEANDTTMATEPALSTEPGRVLGTSSYMSPEQARGQEVDPRSDQFAFGSVLYEMATGRQAFAGDTEADTLAAILRQEPEPPESSGTSMPAALRRVLERCLAKDPAARYESTRDLARELQSLTERSWAVGTEGRHETEFPGPGRRTLAGWIVSALLVLVLSMASFLWWRSVDRTNPEGLMTPEVRHPRSRSRSDTLEVTPPTAPTLLQAPRELASIAVLPLENLGPAAEEYFADGMTDALITQLSKIEALRVISRTSVMRYKASRKSLPEIARELGVENVLSGSVLHGGGRVRISTQLTDAHNDRNLWAESYEENLEDVLALQSQVAKAVVDAISVEVGPAEEARITATRQIDPAAHEAYLRGIDAFERATSRELDFDLLIRASFEFFLRAIDLEPEWAEPYARLAVAYHWLASTGGVDLQAEFYPRSKAAALQALELDDTVALAHAALGWVLLNHEWDWTGAEAAYRRALELDPNTGLGHYAFYLRHAGRYDEAIEYFERAVAREPALGSNQGWVISTLLCAGRPHDAEALARAGIGADPGSANAHLLLGRSLIGSSRYKEAIDALETAQQRSDNPSRFLTRSLAYARAKASHLDEAQRTLRQLEEEGVDWMPELYMALGDRGAALAQIEAAFAARRDVLLGIRCYPEYEEMLRIPRFREIVDAIGFPD